MHRRHQTLPASSPHTAPFSATTHLENGGALPKRATGRADPKARRNVDGMKVVILAGGYGTRLSEETGIRPKPLVEIGGKPILWHIMKIYSAHGLTDFIICGGYKCEMIKAYFRDYVLQTSDVAFDLATGTINFIRRETEPWRISVIDTGETTMTGGRIKQILDHVGDKTFCLTYGDGVSNVDIGDVIRYHKESGAMATLTAVMQPGRFGALDSRSQRTVRPRVPGKVQLRRRPYQWRLFRRGTWGRKIHPGRRYRLGRGAPAEAGARRSACRVSSPRILAKHGYSAGQDGS